MSTDDEQGTKRSRSSGDVIGEPSPKQVRRLLEEEEPAKDDTAEFKWRGDPAETYSDWKIEIVRRIEDGTKKVDVYHVHKVNLACGQRKSGYFHRLFQNGSKFREGSVASSRIELEALAAAAFPNLLDYCYDPSRPLKASTDTALALHYLGEYFEIQTLRYDAVQFIKQDLSVENSHIYVEQAIIFHNDAMIETVAEFLAKNVSEIHRNPAIFKQSLPQLLLKMIGYVDKTDRKACEHCSFAVSRVTLDTATFLEITDSNNIPHLSSSAAVNFILRISKFTDKDGDECDAASPDFTSLEDRCATSLSKGEVALYDPSSKEISKEILLEKASKPFLVDTLFKSWDVLKDRDEKLARCQKELKLLKKKIPRRKSS